MSSTCDYSVGLMTGENPTRLLSQWRRSGGKAALFVSVCFLSVVSTTGVRAQNTDRLLLLEGLGLLGGFLEQPNEQRQQRPAFADSAAIQLYNSSYNTILTTKYLRAPTHDKVNRLLESMARLRSAIEARDANAIERASQPVRRQQAELDTILQNLPRIPRKGATGADALAKTRSICVDAWNDIDIYGSQTFSPIADHWVKRRMSSLDKELFHRHIKQAACWTKKDIEWTLKKTQSQGFEQTKSQCLMRLKLGKQRIDQVERIFADFCGDFGCEWQARPNCVNKQCSYTSSPIAALLDGSELFHRLEYGCSIGLPRGLDFW